MSDEKLGGDWSDEKLIEPLLVEPGEDDSVAVAEESFDPVANVESTPEPQVDPIQEQATDSSQSGIIYICLYTLVKCCVEVFTSW